MTELAYGAMGLRIVNARRRKRNRTWGEYKKKKAAREEDARPDLEYGLGGGVPYSLSSSGRRSELDEDVFTLHHPPQQRPLMHISYAKTLMLKKKADSLIQKTPGNRAFFKNTL
ncbi:hypothetical protein [Brucella anthropi]|uniref:hypothetical protein n=1 Tax=Brucella anthropi TaxID=529 RepID=UPI00235FA8CD|nr:hypothetical protein [Brucella anthropi]